MRPVKAPILLKKGGLALLLLLICLGVVWNCDAGESDNTAEKKQIPYEYSNYDAIISGLASTSESGNIFTVSGSFYNNYWNSFCDIDVYLATIKKDGTKGTVKRFYLGDLPEGETGKYELTVAPLEEIDSLELTFIYEIYSTRHETPADFITITIPWAAK